MAHGRFGAKKVTNRIWQLKNLLAFGFIDAYRISTLTVDRHIFLRLYKQYVRPHLEFSSQAWAPWPEGDRNCLEKAQQRAIKMVSGLRINSYEERLRELNLPSANTEKGDTRQTWSWSTRYSTRR
jgi:hypothetical protein